MEPGSLLLLGHKTNMAYQHSIEENNSKETRISLVLRNIIYKMDGSKIAKRVDKQEEKRRSKEILIVKPISKYKIPARYRIKSKD